MPTIETTGLHGRLGWRTQWRRASAILKHDGVRLGTEVLAQWSDHRVPRLGASLAFYTLLSLAPLVIVVVAVAGAFLGREAVEGQLVWQIQDLIGRAGAETVQSLLRTTQRPGAGAIASIVGAIVLAVGATSAVSELRDALNIIWCVPRKEESGLRSIVSMLRDKGLAFVIVLCIGFLLLLSVGANTALNWFTQNIYGWELSASLFQLTDFVLAFVVISGLFSLIYKWMPDLRLEWKDVLPGAVFTALLFSVGRLFIGYYLGRSSYESLYGAAGSLVIFLVWVYYSAQIFYLGAEFTRAWAQNYGSKPCDQIGREVKLMTESGREAEPAVESSEPLVKAQ